MRWVSLGLSLLLVCLSGVAPVTDHGWLARATSALQAREYEASQTARGLQAPNRAHRLRTYFEPSGIRVHDRASSGPELFALTLVGVGRGAALAEVAPGRVARGAGRVEIRRGALVEWYRNAPDGLEQGFDLSERPAGAGELVLELALGGGSASHGPGGALDLRTATGRVLRYGKLRADDAAGESLPARLELAGAGRIRIAVDDSRATYPLVIDPLLTQPPVADSTVAFIPNNTPGVGDLNGDGRADAIFGVPEGDQGQIAEGVVAIAYGTANGIPNGSTASLQQIQSNITNARFGTSVASGGDLNGDGYQDLIVGAPGANTAYVFLGGASGVTGTTIASAHAALQFAGSSELGVSVAFAGDVNGDGYDDVVVGDYLASRAHLWLGSANGITAPSAPATTLTGAAPFAIGQFVAGAGDVNADGFDDLLVNGVTRTVGGDQLKVLLFHGGASGIAGGDAVAQSDAAVSQSAPPGSGPPGILGVGAGDTNGDGYADVLVGCPALGLAVVFLGSAAGNLFDVDAQFFGAVGYGGIVSAAGDVNADGWADVAVGYASGGSVVHVYLGTDGGVSETNPLAVTGVRVTGGADFNADGFDDLVVTNLDYAIFYHGGIAGIQGGPSNSAQVRFEANSATAGLGVSVSSAGDVNGDGYADIVLGASGYDGGEENEGAVFVIHGGPALPAFPSLSSAASVIQANRVNAFLGQVATGAGDVNGDGYGDLVISVSNYDDGNGLALVYHGGPSGIVAAGTPANASGRFESPTPLAFVGSGVAGADVNGDGFDDVLVTVPGYSDSSGASGAVFALHGSRAGIGNRLPMTANGRLTGSQGSFASRVTAAGDVNRDGFGDVLVSAPTYSNPELYEGAVFVFHGGPAGVGNRSDSAANARIESNIFADSSLSVMGPAGDVNGDGYGDVLFGVPTYTSGETREGGAWLFLGGPTGLTGSALADAASGIGGNSPELQFGNSVAPAGDVNGDGFGDWLIGSPGSASLPAVLGRALLYYGSASPTFAQTPTVFTSEQSLALFGARVGFAGDVDGDAVGDVLVGATSFESSGPENNEGLAVLFQGDRGGGYVLPQQRRSNQGSPIVAPGKSSALLDGFTVEFGAAHLMPRGRIAGEIQACPVGTAFGAPGCTTVVTPWLSGLGVHNTLLSHPFTGLPPHTRYRWRGRALLTDDTGPIPAVPEHGPWRGPQPTVAGFDIRTGRDTDADGVVDSLDNCPRVANAGQEDDGGLGAGSAPDLIGNACQCGNVGGDGRIDATDVTAFRAALANPSGAGLGASALSRCSVLTQGSPCNVVQLSVIRRALGAPPRYPVTTTPAAQFCAAALGS